MTSPDRTLASRFEFKYWLDPERVGRVRQMIRPFVRPDRFAADAPGNRYPLSSLYLDTPGLECRRGTLEGHRNRFKLRIRTYSDDPADPAFFEIKRRMDTVIEKRRGRAERALVERFLKGLPLPEAAEPVAEFVQLSRRIDARPLIHVRYEREAYQSTGRDPVRVTLDTKLCYSTARRRELGFGGPGWWPAPTEGTILEVKFTGSCPSWVTALVRSLSLERTSIPKYVMCIDAALERGALSPDLATLRR